MNCRDRRQFPAQSYLTLTIAAIKTNEDKIQHSFCIGSEISFFVHSLSFGFRALKVSGKVDPLSATQVKVNGSVLHKTA